RVIHRWARATLKWEGSIRKWEAEVIAHTRPVDNRKARKNQANPKGKASVRDALLNRDRDAQERRRKGRGILTFVLAVKQLFEFFLQLSRASLFFRGFERIHGRAI